MTACQCTAAVRRPSVATEPDGAVKIYCTRCDCPLVGASGPWSVGGLIPGNFAAEIPEGSTVIRRGQWLAVAHPAHPAKLIDLATGDVIAVLA